MIAKLFTQAVHDTASRNSVASFRCGYQGASQRHTWCGRPVCVEAEVGLAPVPIDRAISVVAAK